MPSAFDLKKARILQQLSVPDAAYQDASPKGNVDIGIRALVDEINELDSLVTTSSCAGRIAVYLEGKKKSIAAESLQYDGSLEVTANAGAGGKGGGQWLFVSHDPLTSLEWQDDKRRLSASVGFTQVQNQGTVATTPASTQDVRWIRCKFEPMVNFSAFFNPVCLKPISIFALACFCFACISTALHTFLMPLDLL